MELLRKNLKSIIDDKFRLKFVLINMESGGRIKIFYDLEIKILKN